MLYIPNLAGNVIEIYMGGSPEGFTEPNVAQKWFMLYLALILFDFFRISIERYFPAEILILKFIMNPTYELFAWCS